MKVRRIDIMLKLVKPDLIYYEQYNEMMKEWREDGSRIAPWFLDKPCESLDSFYELIRNLDDINAFNQKLYNFITTYYGYVFWINLLYG